MVREPLLHYHTDDNFRFGVVVVVALEIMVVVVASRPRLPLYTVDREVHVRVPLRLTAPSHYCDLSLMRSQGLPSLSPFTLLLMSFRRHRHGRGSCRRRRRAAAPPVVFLMFATVGTRLTSGLTRRTARQTDSQTDNSPQSAPE